MFSGRCNRNVGKMKTFYGKYFLFFKVFFLRVKTKRQNVIKYFRRFPTLEGGGGGGRSRLRLTLQASVCFFCVCAFSFFLMGFGFFSRFCLRFQVRAFEAKWFLSFFFGHFFLFLANSGFAFLTSLVLPTLNYACR